MKKSYYIIAGVIAVILLCVLVFIISPRDNSNNANDENNQESKQNYSEKQIKMARQRKNIEDEVDSKMQEYIKKTVAPNSQKEFDDALKMREEKDRKDLSEDVKDLVKDKNREVKNLNTEVHFENNKQIKGSYYYTLVSSDDNKKTSEDKSGDFVLETNKDDYLYIKEFN